MKYIKIFENNKFELWKSEFDENVILSIDGLSNGWENFMIFLNEYEINLYKLDIAQFIDHVAFLVTNRNKKDIKLRRIECSEKEKSRNSGVMIYIE